MGQEARLVGPEERLLGQAGRPRIHYTMLRRRYDLGHQPKTTRGEWRC